MKALILAGPVLLTGLCFTNLPDLLQAVVLIAYTAAVSAMAFGE